MSLRLFIQRILFTVAAFAVALTFSPVVSGAGRRVRGGVKDWV